MGNKKFTEFFSSEEEEEILPPRSRRRSVALDSAEGKEEVKKRKRLKLAEEEEESEEERDGRRDSKKNKKEVDSGGEEVEDAKPIGESIRSSGKGRGRRKYYGVFEFDGNQFELEDPVHVVPEDQDQKPYVAIIKDIAQLYNGNIMVTGQWFYRPEEAERKGGGSWQSRDTRELFYSFHRDEVPAESVMHKCVVHFVPIHKQLPSRKQHPGFIVQKVYDTVERKLWRLTDKDYEDNKQHEIDLLVQKTLARLGDLPDIESEDGVLPAIEEEDQSKNKRAVRRKGITPLDVTRDDDTTIRNEQNAIAETPGSYTSNSEYNAILLKFKVLTGENHRDKWLERLLQGLRHMCSTLDGMQPDDGGKGAPTDTEAGKEDRPANDSQEKTSATDGKSFPWPDAAIPAVVALEKAAHDALYSDFQKYNQKLRQLVFNLKNNQLLARRLLKKELEPSKILNMTPQELKEGLTEEETAKKEPDESERMQMTDARCRRCSEFKVVVRDIIQAGHGDRYQVSTCLRGRNFDTFDGKEMSMGRKVGTATMPNRPSPSQNPRSVGAAGSVKKPTKGPSTNAKSMLKHEHLQNLALWAGGEASIPSLAAFFGGKLAADVQASAVTPDPSLFPCQRCETILQPGFNCTVRIEKNRSKSRRKKKGTFTLTQNSVVYKCHFCLHQNLRRGTPKGYNKELCPAKRKAPSAPKAVKTVKNINLQAETTKDKLTESNTDDRKPELSNISPDDPATPSVSGKRTLLDSKRRKRNKSGSRTQVDCESEYESGMVSNTAQTVGVSGRKRRNTWTSLKEIVESNGKGDGRTNANTIIPFVL